MLIYLTCLIIAKKGDSFNALLNFVSYGEMPGRFTLKDIQYLIFNFHTYLPTTIF